MDSSFSIATSTWPRRMCACGYDHCSVKVSRSHKNRGRAYYVCPRPMQYVNWIGWCDESGRRSPNHDSSTTDVMQLRADVLHIIHTLRVVHHGHHPITTNIKGWYSCLLPLYISKVLKYCFEQTNKIAYKFKTKPLKHEALMREVFTGVAATGKHHWTPGKKAVDVGDGENELDSVDSPGLQPFIEPYRPVVDSPPNSSIVHVDVADPGTERKKGGSTSGKSKKISSGASVLVDSFNHLSQAVQSQKHLTVRHETGACKNMALRHACSGLWLSQNSSVPYSSILPTLR